MNAKCDASLDFSFLMQMLLQRCKCNFHDANVPCRDENAKFIHDDASAHIYTMMQMSPSRDGDAKKSWGANAF